MGKDYAVYVPMTEPAPGDRMFDVMTAWEFEFVENACAARAERDLWREALRVIPAALVAR
jgi:hypothetical protein